MKIPKKIKIEGITFTIYKLSNEEMETLKNSNEEGDICGLTLFRENKILINSSYSIEMQEQTFMHELVHICDSRMNPLTEEQIDSFARRLSAIFKDNNLFP